MVRTATPTTSASSVDQAAFLRASTRRGGSVWRNGSTSIGALGAELELLVLSDSTPLASFTLVVWPGRSPSAAKRAVAAVTAGAGVAFDKRLPVDNQFPPSFSSGTRSRLR